MTACQLMASRDVFRDPTPALLTVVPALGGPSGSTGTPLEGWRPSRRPASEAAAWDGLPPLTPCLAGLARAGPESAASARQYVVAILSAQDGDVARSDVRPTHCGAIRQVGVQAIMFVPLPARDVQLHRAPCALAATLPTWQQQERRGHKTCTASGTVSSSSRLNHLRR